MEDTRHFKVTLSLGHILNVLGPVYSLSNPWECSFLPEHTDSLVLWQPSAIMFHRNHEKYRGTTEAVGSASRGFPVYLRLRKKKSENYLRTDGACSMKYTVCGVGLICSLKASKQTS